MRISNIDILRGIAAVAVTIFHLTGNSGISDGTKEIGKYGHLGVEIFFVISGYILPYSMSKSNYQPKNFLVLFLKRIFRIDPPYLVIIFITLCLIQLTNRTLPSYVTIFSHLGYLNGILGLQWISPTFWTLSLEFQFYILIGVLYRVLIEKPIYLSLFIIILILLSSFFLPKSFLPHYFGFFSAGILLFRFKKGIMSNLLFWLSTLILHLFVVFNNGILESTTSILTIFTILYLPELKDTYFKKVLLFFGMISYSLYLIHWEIGRTIISLTKYMPVISNYEILRLIIGLVSAIFISWLFYILIELPSINFSRKFKSINEK